MLMSLGFKVRIVKAMVFPVLMYGFENWTIKKGECLLSTGRERVNAYPPKTIPKNCRAKNTFEIVL